MCLLTTLSASPYPVEHGPFRIQNIPSTLYFTVSVANFVLLVKRNLRMVRSSQNGKLNLDSRLRGVLLLIANRLVTLYIWPFNMFVFVAKIQSYDVYVAKLIHGYPKAISQNA